MSPAELLAAAASAGLALRVESGALRVRGPQAERAGIMEFDAGIPRPEAEALAAGATRVFQVLIGMGADEPPRWITMLCPGCTLAEASRICAVKFGAGRVLKVLDHGNPLTAAEPGPTLH